MADNIVPIASAVILPTHPPEVVTVLSKRPQSAASELDSKKLRLDQDDIPQFKKSPGETSTNETTVALISIEKKEERRRISVVEEKKRGQRLFGSLLSALSQSAPNGHQKRRIEILKRQNEPAKTHITPNESQRNLKLTKLNSVRKKEQMKFEEETMRIRHTNMRAMANYLCTKTEPRLYYRPWELLPEQKECIYSQIDSVSVEIERELSDFKQKYNGRPKLEEEKKSEETSHKMSDEPCTENPDKDSSTQAPNTTDKVAHSPEKKYVKDFERGEKEEHNGEVMVENEEDTVIY